MNEDLAMPTDPDAYKNNVYEDPSREEALSPQPLPAEGARGKTPESLMARELIIANQRLSLQYQEAAKRAAELVIANEELAFQNEEKEKRAAELVIANKELAFQNEEKEKRAIELNQLTLYDIVTELPNRRLLLDRIQHAFARSVRSGCEGAVMFIDLDNFKDINDTLGHRIGDLLLLQVAQRLTFCLREADTVARIGGDEFVVVLTDLSPRATEAAVLAKVVAEDILATLSHSYEIEGQRWPSLSSSIGITLFSEYNKTAEELLRRADIAMYQAKREGGNALRFFNPDMQLLINNRVALEGELREAIEKEQFVLHYQVQIDSAQRPLGAEALIRWQHPRRGLLSPAEFIPAAEETGLIVPLGLWVLETACLQLKAWQQDPLTSSMKLAVNVSGNQFHQDDFVAQVLSIVERHAVNPRLLCLEVTESLLLKDVDAIIAAISKLKAIGIQFSLDDFGTGYSSLSYLKRLPLDQIKIDLSFVRNIATDNNDRDFVKAIITLANSLDLGVIAEGVETEEQRQILSDIGCVSYQGYLFGRPMPTELFEAKLKG